METNRQRLIAMIEDISKFNSTPGNGCTRFSYSREDKMVKEYIARQCLDLGLLVRTDAVGNVRVRMEGRNENLPVVMVGSHIDTVRHGGNFDGVVGVVGALESVRVLIENNVRTEHPIELIVFVEEEGSNFGSTLVGSKTLTGKYGLEDLHRLQNPAGKSCYEMAKSFGLNPDHVDTCVLGDNEVKAMLEIHIEQGAVLENNQIPVGIVEAISGMKTVRVVVEGVSNHAGATPMNMRKDPAVGSARIISEIERIASTKTLDSTVATVGRIICEPNVPNVIPGRVEFTVDIRDVKQKGINMTMELMKKAIFAVAKASGLSIRTELIGESESITLSESVLSSIEEATKELHVPYMRMNSGAVHDAAMLAGLTDVGMIFIPSRNGRSHVPEEFSDYGDIKTGCDLLLQTILKVAD